MTFCLFRGGAGAQGAEKGVEGGGGRRKGGGGGGEEVRGKEVEGREYEGRVFVWPLFGLLWGERGLGFQKGVEGWG